MRNVIALLTALVVLLHADLVNAQGPGESHRAAAEALLELLQVEQRLTENMEVILGVQQAQNPDLADEFAHVADMMRELTQRALRWEDLKPDYVTLYTEVYTEDELQQLLEFYRTPIGQRVIATQSEMMLRTAEITQRHVQAYLPELMQRFIEDEDEDEAEVEVPPGR